MKRTRRSTTEASSSQLNRQCPTTSMRRQRGAPQDHFEDTTELEDVAATHDSNVEVHVEPTEPSREREPLRCMSKTSTLHEWNWWGIPNNGIPVFGAAVAPLEDDNDINFELLLRDLDSVASYSWGYECLAWLYKQLSQASRSEMKQIPGYMTLLKALVYEHMHGVVIPDHELDYLEVQPRALRWIPRRDNDMTSVDV
ncbi:unnamed protein product [Prunus armeniaca]